MKRFFRNKFFLLILILLSSLLVYKRFIAPAVPHSDTVQVRPLQTSSGWGYEILVNDRLFIRQTTIPALGGNQGFSSRDKALQAGNLVAGKIKANQFPPSVTQAELDSLHLLN